jgi:iron-sulfur cluster insertion protein
MADASAVQYHEPIAQSATIQPLIHVSNAAANKVAELISEEGNPNLHLRVYITGGGCSGYQYGFTFDEKVQEDDTIIEASPKDSSVPVKLLVDCISIQLLQGAEIDYTSGIQEQFVIRNPNAKTTCGCGSSFSVDDEDF